MRTTYVRGILIAIAVLAVGLGTVFFIHTPARAPSEPSVSTGSTSAEASPETKSEARTASLPAAEKKVSSEVLPETHTAEIPSSSAANISVDGKTYTVDASAYPTVADAMQVLQSRGDVAYSGRTYEGLGFFVESINGRAAANGYNWMLYVNGIQSQAGASSTVLHPKDQVEWKYEK